MDDLWDEIEDLLEGYLNGEYPHVVVESSDSPLAIATFFVALLGVVASTLIAVAAWRTSASATDIAEAAANTASAARQDLLDDRWRNERREFFEALVKRSSMFRTGTTATPFPHDLKRAAATMHDEPQARAIVDWVKDAEACIAAEQVQATADLLLDVLDHNIGDRGAKFIRDADNFELTPFKERAYH